MSAIVSCLKCHCHKKYYSLCQVSEVLTANRYLLFKNNIIKNKTIKVSCHYTFSYDVSTLLLWLLFIFSILFIFIHKQLFRLYKNFLENIYIYTDNSMLVVTVSVCFHAFLSQHIHHLVHWIIYPFSFPFLEKPDLF